MTKQYPVVALGNELYAIDKEQRPKKGEHCHVPDTSLFNGFTGKCGMDDEGMDKAFKQAGFKFYKTIASSDKSLGLPLLPAIEELNPEKLGEIFQKHDLRKAGRNFVDWSMGYVTGYKANKAKYTEEDISFDKVSEIISNYFKVKPVEHFGLDSSDLTVHLLASIKTLKSLKKIPIAVEVEVEEEVTGYYNSIDIPKVDENGFVTVNKWIYDNR